MAAARQWLSWVWSAEYGIKSAMGMRMHAHLSFCYPDHFDPRMSSETQTGTAAIDRVRKLLAIYVIADRVPAGLSQHLRDKYRIPRSWGEQIWASSE
jgi:hypothetical protein